MYHTYFLTVVSCFQWQNENKSKFQLTQSPEWKLDMSTAFKKLKNKILVHRKTIADAYIRHLHHVMCSEISLSVF